MYFLTIVRWLPGSPSSVSCRDCGHVCKTAQGSAPPRHISSGLISETQYFEVFLEPRTVPSAETEEGGLVLPVYSVGLVLLWVVAIVSCLLLRLGTTANVSSFTKIS